MQAFHSTWTKPFFMSHKGDFFVDDFELLTTILSALKWQEFNGDIKMVTDAKGAAYYRKIGLDNLWNLGIESSLEDEIDPSISPSVFWAAGKIFALANEKAPCVMLDTDFIIWEDIKKQLDNKSIVVIHKEGISPQVYPDQAELMMTEDYQFHKDWNWQLEPCNTAFLYMQDEEFKQYYIQESKRFMRATKGENPLTYMVFAEQRLLSMCADEKNREIYALSDLEGLFGGKQKTFTHIWGHKRLLRTNDSQREQFCKRCMIRIQKDYPDFYPIVEAIESLKSYVI